MTVTNAKILAVLTKAEGDRVLLAEELRKHTVEDTRRFDEVTRLLSEIPAIGRDVRSLLDTREAARGAWKLLAILGSFFLGIGAILAAYFHK